MNLFAAEMSPHRLVVKVLVASLISVSSLAADEDGHGPTISTDKNPDSHLIGLLKESSQEVFWLRDTMKFDAGESTFELEATESTSKLGTNYLQGGFISKARNKNSPAEEFSNLYFRIERISARTIKDPVYNYEYAVKLSVFNAKGELVPNHPISSFGCFTKKRVGNLEVLMGHGSLLLIRHANGYAFVGDKVVKLANDDIKTAPRAGP
jgi:hypothetical protein